MSSWALFNSGVDSGAQAHVSFSPITIGVNIGDYLEFDIEAADGNPLNIYRIAAAQSSGFASILRVAENGIGLRFSAGNEIIFNQGYTHPQAGQRFVFRIERVGANQWQCFLDGQNLGVLANSNQFFPRQFFHFDVGTNEAFRGRFYKVTASTNGGASVTNEWDPSASNGTGSTLFDTVGGNHGTLVKFPTDDSQWVPYGDPSDDIDATIALTMPQFMAAVSAATTAPGVSASAAFTMPQFTALVDAEQQAPQYAASVALTMPQFTAAITGEAAAPTAGATVAFTMPQFIAAATAESTVPEFPAVASFTMPQFGIIASAEASLPATGAVVAYTMPQFTVSASGATTVPTFTADVAYTMPQFGVMVLTDETPLGTAPGARLAWVAGSNKLAYNVGSNRLSWRA